MDWQFTFTIGAIVFAAAFILWRGRRTWQSLRTGCSGGCGCAKSGEAAVPGLIAPEKLTLRRTSP